MSTREHKEGEMTKEIEDYTADLPSDLFFAASVMAMGTSLGLKLVKKNHAALFFGQWATSFLLFGIYNKLVKIGGHDRKDRK